MICDLLGKPRELITFVPDRLGHDLRYALDSGKLRALGWKPETGFDAALASTVLWYKAHDEWWRKIKDRAGDFQSFYATYYKDRK
jgi:dTDP-glucose 4,6-dehydratase